MEVDKGVVEPVPNFRTSEDALKLLEHAKLDPADHLSLTQSLVFSNDFANENDLKLLEVDSELLDHLCKGERVTIRGEAEDFAVLCTNSKTYEIRVAETSNSLLISPSLSIPSAMEDSNHIITQNQVTNIHFKYFELKQCQPRIGKLYKILSEKLYTRSCVGDHGYTWDELLNLVQSSEKEMLEGLRKLKAYFIEGRWCLLEFDYHFGVLSSFLNFIDSNSLPLNVICKQEVIEALRELEPVPVLEQCFEYFFTPVQEESDADVYEIKELEVSQCCAEVLLRPAGKFNLHEFLNIWQQSVPEGITTHLSHLKGVALVDEVASPPVVWHFPVTAIPLDLSQAFSALFETRHKWTLEGISPYLQEFASPKTNVAALLTKHARASTVNGVKYYTCRHST